MANRKINYENQYATVGFTWRAVLYPALVVVIVGICIGLLEPFGMHQIPVYVSIAYWVTTCLVGYVIYWPVIALLNSLLAKRLAKRWCRIAIGTIIASIMMSLVVPIITWLFLGHTLSIVEQFTYFFPKCLLIGGIITVVVIVRGYIAEQKRRLMASEEVLEQTLQQTDVVLNKAYEDFMKKIPLEKRGKLLCLEMSDHYVKAHTDQGHHMMLMRFKDAIKSLDGYSGLQTHRSWWVANDAITKVQKEQRKVQLVLVNGLVIPVSRTYHNNLTEAGFSA